MRIVVLVSGSGTNLQALLDAAAAERLPFELVAVGSDIAGCRGLERANAAAVPTFAVPLSRGGDREAWNQELAQAVRER
ncbi:MAG TPA: phosphoribosylglycinamide formyltransferase, partial [Candidatus Nesterenkonia stercoripullorum]|nr:phosphoribosylglycinamide formyltransferase [Candidatus Nesterenkonia stercoripullorum]